MTKHPSALEYALLGLLAEGPQSGYDVRKVFATTAMRVYSDSPGSIYPALARLARRKLVLARRERTGRRRTAYALSPRGRALVRGWLAEPVTVTDVMRNDGSLELKLAFMSRLLPMRLVSFLDEWSAAAEALAVETARDLTRWRGELPVSGELALVLGRDSLRSRAAALRRARVRVASGKLPAL
jgi:DNA-binding PadR family transcriptional regulator